MSPTATPRTHEQLLHGVCKDGAHRGRALESYCKDGAHRARALESYCKDGAHRAWALESYWPVPFQVFQQLEAAHAALEEDYLKACRERHLSQQLAGSQGTPRRFDPDRYLLGREAWEDRWARPQVPTRRGTLHP